MLKRLIKKYFGYFYYFYSFLRYRAFVALVLSLLVAALDGFGMAMFMPLLQAADGQSKIDAESLGNLRFLLDFLVEAQIPLTIASVLIVMFFFFLLKGVARFWETYYKVLLARFFIKRVRFSQIDDFCNYSYTAFVKTDVGRIQNTLSGEVGRLITGYRAYFMAVQAAVMVFVYVLLAFLANPEFSVLVIAGGLLSNVVYRRLYRKTTEASRVITKESHHFQSLLVQKVTFYKYLKATGQLRRYANKLKSIILEMEAVTKRMGWYNSILAATKEPLIVLVVVGVILVQLYVFSASINLIVLSLLFFYRSLTYLMNLQNQWNSFLTVSGSIENMQSFAEELNNGQERNGKLEVQAIDGGLELKNVFFAYGSNEILKDINLEIKKNETVAFVGESGSGKTTLVNVLSGLLPVTKGTFYINGNAAENINMQTYQARIGYITQEPVVFSDSVFNNVTFWAEKNGENLSRFWDALRKASIDDFVRSLAGMEDSMLGYGGVAISGGQKQRISIARELYKKVDILIMDEATSALDSETEKNIQENIDALKGQYTILIIAHRLSTIKNANRVVLMDKGMIKSTGDFNSLKASSRLFEKMVELQEV